ncbi:MAG: PIN domain-containing protein [Candidatus Acidiferrales bacterium]
MKTFLDTSVLLPAFLEYHEHHEASLNVLLKAEKNQSYCAGHSLAELYAAATRLPGKHRLSGEQVLLYLENVRERLTIITLTGDEYYAVVKEGAAGYIVGGMIYDAILARCALKAGAEVIYTWNMKHFQRLGTEVAKRLRTP